MQALSSYYNDARTFVSRHRRVLYGFAGVSALVCGYVLYRNVAPVIANIRAELIGLEALSVQLADEQNANRKRTLQTRFRHTNDVAASTIRTMTVQVRDRIAHRFAVEEYRKTMSAATAATTGTTSASGSSGAVNAQVIGQWETFKILGVSRTVAAATHSAVVASVVATSMAIVSRYVYNDAQSANAARAAVNEKVNEAFLELCQRELASALDAMSAAVETAVREHFAVFELAAATQAPMWTRAILRVNDAVIDVATDVVFPRGHKLVADVDTSLSALTASCIGTGITVDDAAVSRLQSMAAEMSALVHAASFRAVLSDVMSAAEQELTAHVSDDLPFATSLVRFIKAFTTIMPQRIGESTPIIDRVIRAHKLHAFTSIVYSPMDETGQIERIDTDTTTTLPPFNGVPDFRFV